MTANPILEAENATVVLGKHKVLDDVSFTIQPGEYVGIVGPNGGGKTTLLRAMLGLLSLNKGEIYVKGKKVSSPSARKCIGYVPQHFTTSTFAFAMSVEEVVATGLVSRHNFGPLRKEDRTAIDEALELVAASSLKKRMFSDLSGGQRQRVVIARAMVGKPAILFLDEPLSAVDLPSQKNFYETLSQLNKKKKLTIIMVTHDIEMVTAEASRVLCLNRRLHASCKPTELSNGLWDETFGEEFIPIKHKKHHV
ncbi:MAG: ABC transporter ATP-binding protein [Patescibacteria group bacterium]